MRRYSSLITINPSGKKVKDLKAYSDQLLFTASPIQIGKRLVFDSNRIQISFGLTILIFFLFLESSIGFNDTS